MEIHKVYRKNGIASIMVQKLIEAGLEKRPDRPELRATSEGESVYRQFGFVEPHDKPMEPDLHTQLR